ncbi:hypothetical protein ED733_001470 [Metarhizium rileyi]|uniref:Uncharacterized protein n=1 Tax=Metarhizium rileyi (strain RCEF 4871) TaxID=1649241 RepID=A0A5C6GFU6_METRR|nr:hypothetical protein ED733_001470 [Metarhizium rileyi]
MPYKTMSVPADMLALRTVEQPVHITVPGTAQITVTGHTNARFYQKVTVTDVANGKIYIFTGSGENETEMKVHGSEEKGPVLLDTLPSQPLHRTLTVLFEFSSQGEGSLEKSAVLMPRVQCEYNGLQHLKRMSWEITSEDGVDSDYNDAVIRIVADVDYKFNGAG